MRNFVGSGWLAECLASVVTLSYKESTLAEPYGEDLVDPVGCEGKQQVFMSSCEETESGS